jgi:hypothetical protein
MKTYKVGIKKAILKAMEIDDLGSIAYTDKRLDEEIEKTLAEGLTDTQEIAFSYLYHCYGVTSAVNKLRRDIGIVTSVSALSRAKNRAKKRIIKLAKENTNIHEWGREWREAQKFPRRS